MTDVIIEAERLGKSYRIGAAVSRQRYTALRDVMTVQARRLVHRLRRPLRREASHRPGPTQEFWALRDVCFQVKRGEAVGIIGRNGAGKSTLLKVLSRITEPSEGRVTLRGRVASLLEVGTGFHPELTGRENIYLNGAILGMTSAEIKCRFDDIVDFAEIGKFLDTPVKRYSSGMYVRLAFAVAAHLDPEILVVDEVLAVGDIQFQEKCLGKMQHVSSSGRTVLFVSHNLAAIKRLCGAGILLEQGKVISTGGAADVITAYLERTQVTNPDMHVLDVRCPSVSCEFSEFAMEHDGDDILFSTRIRGSHSLSFLGIGLTIRSEIGDTVMHLRPVTTGFGVLADQLPCHFKIRMPGLAEILCAGRYWVSIWISDPGKETFGKLDDILWFDVDEKSCYKTGRSSNARQDGVISVPCQLTTEELSLIEGVA